MSETKPQGSRLFSGLKKLLTGKFLPLLGIGLLCYAVIEFGLNDPSGEYYGAGGKELGSVRFQLSVSDGSYQGWLYLRNVPYELAEGHILDNNDYEFSFAPPAVSPSSSRASRLAAALETPTMVARLKKLKLEALIQFKGEEHDVILKRNPTSAFFYRFTRPLQFGSKRNGVQTDSNGPGTIRAH